MDDQPYITFVRRCKKFVSCYICHVNIMVRRYESHLAIQHNIGGMLRRHCEWCNKDGKNFKHRYACVKRRQKKTHWKTHFPRKIQLDILPWTVNYQLTSYEFNNRDLDNWLKTIKQQNGVRGLFKYGTFENDINTMAPFDNDNYDEYSVNDDFYDQRMNIHDYFIKKWDNNFYCYKRVIVDRFDWLWFKRFLDIVRSMQVRIYPYWSCCKRGKRHMIIRYPRCEEADIERQWNILVAPTVIKKELKTRQHFISNLVQVSNIFMQHNYYVNKPLPPYAAFFMSLLYDNGVEEYYTAKYRNKNIEHCTAIRANDEWTVPLGCLDDLRDLVLPIHRNKRLHPTNFTTINLPNGEAMSIREWNNIQLSTGNRFINRLADNNLKLSKKQQQILDAINKYIIYEK